MTKDHVVLAVRIDQCHIDQHKANFKSGNVVFASLPLPKCDHVSNIEMDNEIWSTHERYHEGMSRVKTRLFERHRREYELCASFWRVS